MEAETKVEEIRVWDLPVRIFHWLLVVAFTVSYITEGEPEFIHVWSGYGIAALVILRIFWGFRGPGYARFSGFLYSPGKIFSYLRQLIGGGAARYVGHSPAGGAMAVALLLSLVATALAGMTLLAADDNEGPLAGLISPQTRAEYGLPSLAVIAVREASEDEDEAEDEDKKPRNAAVDEIQDVHEFLANLTLALIILHLGGVGLASYRHRENLARAMVTGNKRPPDA